MTGPRVAVVGGGMAGLELAAALTARATARVTVIERGPAARREHVLLDGQPHPGDEKTRRWVGSGWGPAGGLAERLGGRSLCYHGVFLGIEPPVLDAWPAAWAERLAVHYRTIPAELAPAFPELRPPGPSPAGLRHVPQAAAFVPDGRRLAVYTPLTAVLEQARRGDLRIVRAAAVRVQPAGGRSWTVAVEDPDGRPAEVGPFDACVLASSAIGNVQLLSRSLDREITTALTDHLHIGGLVRLPPGPPLNELRHYGLWSGYVPVPELNAKLFVRELERLPNGDRHLDIHAVAEQDPTDASTLLVAPRPERDGTRITPVVSAADGRNLAAVQERIRDLAESLAGAPVTRETDARLDWGPAREAVTRQAANSLTHYQRPYGEYDHEASTHPMGGAAIGIGEDLGVAELPGVHVAGPGAFPRIGAANPALTILAMSRSLAGILDR